MPQLLEVVKYNNARQMDSVALYEIGSVFLKQDGEQLPEESEHVAGAITGLWEANLWQGEKKPVDFYVAKGVLEALFDDTWFDESKSLIVKLKSKICIQDVQQKSY